jgi:hypothetical protein
VHTRLATNERPLVVQLHPRRWSVDELARFRVFYEQALGELGMRAACPAAEAAFERERSRLVVLKERAGSYLIDLSRVQAPLVLETDPKLPAPVVEVLRAAPALCSG